MKGAVLNTIKRSRKKPLQKEDDQVLGNDKKGREGGSEQLAVEPPEAPASLIPDALKRDLVLHYPEECSNKVTHLFRELPQQNVHCQDPWLQAQCHH